MEYKISSFKDSVLIKVVGPFNRNAIYSVSTFLEPFLKSSLPDITLDIDDLSEEKEIIFHFGLVNAFKKEIDQAGGRLTVRTARPLVRKYLQNTGLDKIFDIADAQLIA